MEIMSHLDAYSVARCDDAKDAPGACARYHAVFDAEAQAVGDFCYYELYPGADMAIATLSGVDFSRTSIYSTRDHVLMINICIDGPNQSMLAGDVPYVLKPGDIAMQMMDTDPFEGIAFPEGHYRGIVFYIDFAVFADNLPYGLRDVPSFAESLRERYAVPGRVTHLTASQAALSLVAGVDSVPQQVLLRFLQLQFQSLLLFLYATEQIVPLTALPHTDDTVRTVQQIHDFLVADLSANYTVAELSKRFFLSPSVINAVFKDAYGNPPAAYVKKQRMNAAASLLRDSYLLIADIASMVGYRSASKFGAAFKREYGMLPGDYRRAFGLRARGQD